MTSWSGQPEKSWPHDQRARPRAYNLKAVADYETGPGSRVSAESAREAIATARRFVECVASLIPSTGHAPARTPDPTP